MNFSSNRVTQSGLLAVFTFFFACSSGISAQKPVDTLHEYAQAIEAGEVEKAYSFLSDEAKQSIRFETFKRMVQENRQDLMEMVQALSRPAQVTSIEAFTTLPDGQKIHFIYENDRWFIDSSAIDLYGQLTPRQSLESFVRACENKRYDVIVRFVPKLDDKENALGQVEEAPEELQVTPEMLKLEFEGNRKEEVEAIVQALKTSLPDSNIEEIGNDASFMYAEGKVVKLIREDGVWKIRDF